MEAAIAAKKEKLELGSEITECLRHGTFRFRCPR
jgi:hypothetical protein